MADWLEHDLNKLQLSVPSKYPLEPIIANGKFSLARNRAHLRMVMRLDVLASQ